jgi:hypothetical protein
MDEIDIAGLVFLILAIPIGKLIGWILKKIKTEYPKNQKL